MKRSRRQREGKSVLSVTSGAELAKLLNALDRQWLSMVSVMALAGLRLGEEQVLRVEDVELDRGRLIVRRSR